MIVLIDIGNSRIKLGWLDPATGERETEPAALDRGEAQAQLQHWLTQLPSPPSRAVGTNVAGDTAAQRLETVLQSHGCPVRWYRAEPARFGLSNGYTRPEQLGADRWAAMLGLRTHLPSQHGPVMLASFGTATTIDTIGPDGHFPGGLILPGPALMLESLARNTANLPLVNGAAVEYPTDTHEAIATGVAAAQAGAILRQWLAGFHLYGEAPEIYVTGGGWPHVANETRRLLTEAARLRGIRPPAVHERTHLVLDGVATLATMD